jgi:hypothetical protein
MPLRLPITIITLGGFVGIKQSPWVDERFDTSSGRSRMARESKRLRKNQLSVSVDAGRICA